MAAAAVTVMAAIATGADTTRPFGWAAVTVTYGYSGGKEVYQSVWVYVLSRQAWGATMMVPWVWAGKTAYIDPGWARGPA